MRWKKAPPATSERARLREIRLKILHFHQALLQIERKSDERIHRRVNSGELLQLVINRLNSPTFYGIWRSRIPAEVSCSATAGTGSCNGAFGFDDVASINNLTDQIL
jgi:hypothetical protein